MEKLRSQAPAAPGPSSISEELKESVEDMLEEMTSAIGEKADEALWIAKNTKETQEKDKQRLQEADSKRAEELNQLSDRIKELGKGSVESGSTAPAQDVEALKAEVLDKLETVRKDLERQVLQLPDKVKDDELFKTMRQDLNLEKACRVELAERFEELAEKADPASRSASGALASMDSGDMDGRMSDSVKKTNRNEDAIKELNVCYGHIKGLVEEVTQRLEANEATSQAFREEMMCAGSGQVSPSSSAKETATASQALTLARTCNNDVKELGLTIKSDQASIKDLATRLEAMASQLESLEKAPTPRSMESTLLPGQQAAGSKTPQLEGKIEELQKQVSAELQQLTEHQRIIAKVAVSGGAPAASNLNTQDLERSVEQLAGQVASELRELRDHQSELNKVRDALGGESGKADSVEPKIKDLHRKVSLELEGLSKQQEELSKAKVNMAHLAEGLRECRKATASLEDRFSRLSGKASPSKSSEVPALASLSSASGNRPARTTSMALPEVKVATSDSDESYGNEDFDESVEEVSLSGGR
mmetsp:Transcript_58382/g.103819  ORF Transcript_58382/g.103819 Transcript_58382/m.103819 type:complete len:535 (+) Transcript_58382:3-1607(+)